MSLISKFRKGFMKNIILSLCLLISVSAFAIDDSILICKDSDGSLFKVWSKNTFNALHLDESYIEVGGRWEIDGETRGVIMMNFEVKELASKDKAFSVRAKANLFNENTSRGLFTYSAQTGEAKIEFVQYKNHGLFARDYAKTAILTCSAP